MIKINFKEVCNDCEHRNTYMDEHIFYSGNDEITVRTEIGCNHEKVCAMYRSAEMEEYKDYCARDVAMTKAQVETYTPTEPMKFEITDEHWDKWIDGLWDPYGIIESIMYHIPKNYRSLIMQAIR